MKIKIDIDCTPQEARAFFGLPDVEPIQEAVPCHTELQTRHGIWNIENLDFEPLLADGVSEFLFVWAPLKIVGGTGSPGNPVALY
jgi:kynurenine formamidase